MLDAVGPAKWAGYQPLVQCSAAKLAVIRTFAIRAARCSCRSLSNGRGAPVGTTAPDAPRSADATAKRRPQPGTAKRQLAGSPAAASQPGRPLEAVLLQLGTGAAPADAAGWGGGDMGSWLEQQEAAAAEAAGPAPMPASPQGGSAGSTPGQRKASEVEPFLAPENEELHQRSVHLAVTNLLTSPTFYIPLVQHNSRPGHL